MGRIRGHAPAKAGYHAPAKAGGYRTAWLGRLCVVLLLLGCGLVSVAWAQPADDPASPPTVQVTLWFDTEDYLLPADDDASLRLAQFLSERGVRATFKLVGEKARVLEQRKRFDVIQALQRHEIGYHTDFHSVQPTIALFLSTQGWDDGVAEFDRRERRGFDDIARILGQRPTCYGQPGSSWGPQVYGALRRWGVPVYLDAGRHVELEGRPFWYGGVLHLYALRETLRTGLAKPEDLEAAKPRFREAYERLLAEGGGVVSIYYHPCEFVHRQFWDGVNFSKGANPPRSQWKVPPQKTAEETARAFANFEGYIRYIQEFPAVRFVTAGDAATLYRDRAQRRAFDQQDLKAMAQAVDAQITYYQQRDFAVAPSEVFLLLNHWLLARSQGRPDVSILLSTTPWGPTSAFHGEETIAEVSLDQLARTAADVESYLDRHGRLPNAVWLGSTPISPERYLVTIARLLAREGTLPATAPVAGPGECRLATEKYVAQDAPALWGWVIFPPGFRAPEMMQMAKRQAWTLKPAQHRPLRRSQQGNKRGARE